MKRSNQENDEDRPYGYKASKEVQSKILVSKEKSHKKLKTRSYSQGQPTQYKRNEKTIPTEELLKMTELMLKNNYFEFDNEMK